MSSDQQSMDFESRVDELEALAAIYGKDFTQHDDASTFDVRICCDQEKWWAVTISVLMPETYPSKEAPFIELHTECMARNELDAIHEELERLWRENFGGNILYTWTEKVREMLSERYENAKLFIESPEQDKIRERALTGLMRSDETSAPPVIKDLSEEKQPDSMENIPEIRSSETITLKKSTFQGHAAIVHTVDDVKNVLKKLKENKKVSQASHNIVAYRLSGIHDGTFVQDYADDGEINAGGRVLHLLQIMDVKNLVVVVSRWYGGILLGPDRFRLINNCAREVIMMLPGVYEPKQEKAKRSKKKKQ